MSNQRMVCTRDGKKRIKDLTDSHLCNMIKYIERRAEQAMRELLFPYLQGEMASYYAEQEYYSTTVDDFLPDVYSDLVEEKIRRSLNEKGVSK